jgi:hypothetical protein
LGNIEFIAGWEEKLGKALNLRKVETKEEKIVMVSPDTWT